MDYRRKYLKYKYKLEQLQKRRQFGAAMENGNGKKSKTTLMFVSNLSLSVRISL